MSASTSILMSVLTLPPVMLLFMARNLDTYTSTGPVTRSPASSSVSPTVASGGWMNTAEGTCRVTPDHQASMTGDASAALPDA